MTLEEEPMTLEESGLQLTILEPKATKATLVERDQSQSKEQEQFRQHMKKVDFVIELSDRYLFIEFKNYEQSTRSKANISEDKANIQKDIDKTLYYKFRDNWLSCWMKRTIEKPLEDIEKPLKDIEKPLKDSKPIYYYVLLEAKGLESAMLSIRSDYLKSVLPVVEDTNLRSIAKGACVFNCKAWNEKFGKKMKVTRINDANTQ